MVKKIKQIVFFAAFLLQGISVVTAADIRLDLKNVDWAKRADGKDVATIGLSQSFDIDIIITGANQKSEKISVPGLEAVEIMQQGQSSSMQTVNGVSTSEIIYHITVRPRSEGSFTLGPVQIELDGKTVFSNAIPVDVGKIHTQSTNQQASSRSGQASVLCKLSVDKQHVVVGEPITLTLAVYQYGPILDMGLEKVAFEGFSEKDLTGKTDRNEVIDGIPYRVQEIKYILTPLQEGAKVIKPISVQYLVQSQKKRTASHGHFNFGGAIEAFFGQQPEQMRATSNELNITVSPLPAHKGQVHGIGDFSSFTASINKKEADLNEPLTLTFSVEGKGNFEQIPAPTLILPKWFKSYDSKTEIEQTVQGSKKKFSFVLQANKPGSVQVPSQIFTFFDVNSRSFKTLKTKPINLEIIVPDDYRPAPLPVAAQADSDHAPQNLEQNIDVLGGVRALTQVQSLYLPWWVFMLLLLAPLLIFRKKILKVIKSVITKLFGARIYRHNLALFQKELDAMQKKGDAGNLHQLFLKFLATKYSVDIDVVTEDWIERLLHDAQWIPEKIEEFLEFLSVCAQLQFMRSKSSSIDQNVLLKKSNYWLIMLNK